MKICAITMVYRDYWALDQWYTHFSRHLGAGNLIVVAHGADPEIARVCPGASVITIPREDLSNFDNRRGDMLNAFQNGLNQIYDWVIRTDADELICLDPARYRDFADFFTQQDTNALFALGLNLGETASDATLAEGQPVLSARRSALFTGNYSKAWAVRNRVGLKLHGVQLRPARVARFPFVMPRGAYLVHLKYANATELAKSAQHRREVADQPGTGNPGPAWLNPGADARRFFKQLEALPELPWEEAEPRAYAEISVEPVREEQRGVVRARRDTPRIRTRLPDWFSGA
ncbi:glycosyltransferase family 2 protein [Ruegeria sp. WL0004]|uniref:Glycosyltransferase family 2 protein n=1 Tax=Ruegeria marisflavi TaxID=2984152 RepID=A0ABT2WWB8_9RHOB|nr:glycosyltransferase family 2 protein [Ruegeria sp. WL0004]MCU9839335.1 glycosyltransferase family 2 protein [Ruegeria sp. WL0004]